MRFQRQFENQNTISVRARKRIWVAFQESDQLCILTYDDCCLDKRIKPVARTLYLKLERTSNPCPTKVTPSGLCLGLSSSL